MKLALCWLGETMLPSSLSIGEADEHWHCLLLPVDFTALAEEACRQGAS